MPPLPFRDAAEAADNATCLCSCLRFYSVFDGSSGKPLGLDQVQHLIAKYFSHRAWGELVRTLDLGHAAAYLDSKDQDQKAVVALRFADLIGDRSAVERIKDAIGMAGFGNSPERRLELQRLFGSLRENFRTIEQWNEIDLINRGYHYVTRYPSRRSEYETRLMEYQRDKRVAEVLGLPLPRKPKRPSEPWKVKRSV